MISCNGRGKATKYYHFGAVREALRWRLTVMREEMTNAEIAMEMKISP